MEENQNEVELDVSTIQENEPVQADNSQVDIVENPNLGSKQVQEEGQSLEIFEEIEKDPSKELILGKFKSVEDLTKAYEELQKRQGQSSDELGSLRKEMQGVNELKEQLRLLSEKQNEYLETIERDKQKYTAPEYFQDPTFKEIYKEALMVYGANLDTDRMIDLIEKYVSSRIQLDAKKKLAQKETQNVLDSMKYSKNPNAKFTPPKKSFDEMTPQEVDELLDRLI